MVITIWQFHDYKICIYAIIRCTRICISGFNGIFACFVGILDFRYTGLVENYPNVLKQECSYVLILGGSYGKYEKKHSTIVQYCCKWIEMPLVTK